MRIMWMSVPPMVPTGYGTQTKLMIRALRDQGHEIAVACTTGTPMTTLVWDGIRLYPDSGYNGKYGTDMIKTHADRWGADVVISWLDAFAIPPEVANKLKWAAWTPVDSEPIMIRNVKALQACKWTMAPTHWGVRMLKEAGLVDTMFMPCAHDPNVFFPMTSVERSKEEFGKLIKRDLKGKFLVNVVSANAGGRKNFQAVFYAWKIFHALHPDAELYLHTDITGYFSGGNDLVEMAKTYGITDDSVFYVSQWEYNTGQLADDYLNLLYNASDCHLNCCYGEGFGLPIMDAQAAGCPTVVPDFAAASEVGLCKKITQGQMYSTVPGALQFMVDPADVVAQLEAVYSERKTVDRFDISKKTEPWRIENVVQEHLLPILEKMQKEM